MNPPEKKSSKNVNPLLGIIVIIAVWLPFVLFSPGSFDFFEYQDRSKVARIRGDQRTLTIALETYYLDQRAYPAWSADPVHNAFGGLKDRDGLLKKLPTFRQQNGSALATLTTPIAYISTYFADPRAPIKGMPCCYWANDTATTTATGFILWSPGPDGAYDLTLDNIAEAYNPTQRVPSDYLTDRTYDPSNGTQSRGDVYRVKQ